METAEHKLARELWNIGYTARYRGSGPEKWEGLSSNTRSAWEAVATHVLGLVKKGNTIRQW